MASSSSNTAPTTVPTFTLPTTKQNAYLKLDNNNYHVVDSSHCYTASPWFVGYCWWLIIVSSKVHNQLWTKGSPQSKIHYLEQGLIPSKCDHILPHWKCFSHCLWVAHLQTGTDNLGNQVCLTIQVKNLSYEETTADIDSRTKSLFWFSVDC
jgi:hypothetical protein